MGWGGGLNSKLNRDLFKIGGGESKCKETLGNWGVLGICSILRKGEEWGGGGLQVVSGGGVIHFSEN